MNEKINLDSIISGLNRNLRQKTEIKNLGIQIKIETYIERQRLPPHCRLKLEYLDAAQYNPHLHLARVLFAFETAPSHNEGMARAYDVMYFNDYGEYK